MKTENNMTWDDAIITVLSTTNDAMHYVDITKAIIDMGLRKNLGATPAATVCYRITTSIKKEGKQSPFVRTGSGVYMLRQDISGNNENLPGNNNGGQGENPGLITSFGVFWKRDRVSWGINNKLLGKQQVGAQVVDFANQKGIYLLHDRREVVYIGSAVDQTFSMRLYNHTLDRLNGRWDRFSWFGILPITEEGKLEKVALSNSCSPEVFIKAVEAILIETVEPPLVRKRDDDLYALEYLQEEDGRIKKRSLNGIIEQIDDPR